MNCAAKRCRGASGQGPPCRAGNAWKIILLRHKLSSVDADSALMPALREDPVADFRQLAVPDLESRNEHCDNGNDEITRVEALYTPSFSVVCGRSIISLLMMLNPWEKARRYQGHTAWLLRKKSCTRARTTRKDRKTGSHHSWEVGEYDEAGKIRSGTS